MVGSQHKGLRKYFHVVEVFVWTSENLSQTHQSAAHKLVRQVRALWDIIRPHSLKYCEGQFEALSCTTAFISNGKHVIFVFKTGNEGLTFSDFIRWDDKELYLVFLGFTMFAADCALTQYKSARDYDVNILEKILTDIWIPAESSDESSDLPED